MRIHYVYKIRNVSEDGDFGAFLGSSGHPSAFTTEYFKCNLGNAVTCDVVLAVNCYIEKPDRPIGILR